MILPCVVLCGGDPHVEAVSFFDVSNLFCPFDLCSTLAFGESSTIFLRYPTLLLHLNQKDSVFLSYFSSSAFIDPPLLVVLSLNPLNSSSLISMARGLTPKI